MSIINPGLQSPFTRVNREEAWFLGLKRKQKPCDWMERLKGDGIQGFLTSNTGMLKDLGVSLLTGYMLTIPIHFLAEGRNHKGTASFHAQDLTKETLVAVVLVECTREMQDACFYCESYTILVSLLVWSAGFLG